MSSPETVINKVLSELKLDIRALLASANAYQEALKENEEIRKQKAKAIEKFLNSEDFLELKKTISQLQKSIKR